MPRASTRTVRLRWGGAKTAPSRLQQAAQRSMSVLRPIPQGCLDLRQPQHKEACQCCDPYHKDAWTCGSRSRGPADAEAAHYIEKHEVAEPNASPECRNFFE